MRSRPRLVAAALLTALVASLLTVMPAPGAQDRALAADAALFDAGYLVSDQQFFDGDAMSAAQVQAFIDAEHPGCSAGFTCLDTYRQSTVAIPADGFCGALPATTNERASSIIARVGAACDISQRVLLVTLQKEQSLVTHPAPNAVRYARATGFACPDTAPCNTAFGGFYYQLYFAARQFNRYAALPQNYNHQAGETNQVLFHPNAACGSSPVFIRNTATAGLYNYTPYQPNAAALANLYSTGDACSSYGNRNFWRMWTDWFGDPTVSGPGIALPTPSRLAGGNRFETSVAIAQRAYPSGAPVVYLASGQDFPDGLSAGPAAAHSGGPVLLTPRATAPDAVLAEIRRLAPAQVVIVGDTPSVSAEVEAAVRALDPAREVLRLGGANRYETSRLIAEHAFGAGAASVFVATGARFPDALAAGPAAAFRDGPVLLIDGSADALDDATRATLGALGAGWVGVVGDVASVSGPIGTDIRDSGITVRRYAGANRFATAADLRGVFGAVSTVYVASGQGFADALSGAAAAGAEGAPMLLTRQSCVPEVTLDTMLAADPAEVVLLGGLPTINAVATRYTTC